MKLVFLNGTLTKIASVIRVFDKIVYFFKNQICIFFLQFYIRTLRFWRNLFSMIFERNLQFLVILWQNLQFLKIIWQNMHFSHCSLTKIMFYLLFFDEFSVFSASHGWNWQFFHVWIFRLMTIFFNGFRIESLNFLANFELNHFFDVIKMTKHWSKK